MKTKTVMIYPDNKQEQAIHNYSEDLLKHTKTDSLTYTRGKPFTFPFFKALKYKTIHIQHEYNLLGWYGLPFFILLPLLWLFGRRLILTMHTVLSPVDVNVGILRTFFYIAANIIIGLTKTKIIVHSEAFKNILVCDYFFNEKSIVVIRHGVKEVPKFDREKIKKELGLKGNVILLIGTFHKDHQPHLVIYQADKIDGEIFIVWNSDKGWKFNVYYDKCYKYAKENWLTKNISSLDLAETYHDHQEWWWEFFYAADVVALPYVDGIGSGIFQDAMATRTPVVCSNTDYFREMLGYNGGENPKDACGEIAIFDHDFPRAIKYAIKHQVKLRKGCDAYANKYSVKNMAKKTLRVYR